ncbi:MAG: hypothetical protein R2867_23410 [Caldilineaceae bacterium]
MLISPWNPLPNTGAAQLALLLWPDQPRNRAFDSLRQTLFTVRQWIPAHYLHVTRLISNSTLPTSISLM